MIEFNVEWYGSHARPSALCDYLELLALNGNELSEEIIADFVRDAHYTHLLWETVVVEADPSLSYVAHAHEEPDLRESIDAALDVVKNTLAELHERQEILASAYPYYIPNASDIVLVRREDVSDWCVYDSLLSLTVAHANRLQVPDISLTDLFERIVEDSLKSGGLATARLQNGETNYASRATRAAEHVGRKINVANASYRRRAVDEGTDLISNLWPRDRRHGGIQLIGQATCAKSDEWEEKMTEPKPAHWRDMLGSGPFPTRYLAVPHHVGSSYRRHLLKQETDVDIVDRLRLALTERPLLDDERAVCDRMASEDVISPT